MAVNRTTVRPPDNTEINIEQLWINSDRREMNNSRGNLSQCHYCHYKSKMDCPGHEPGRLQLNIQCFLSDSRKDGTW